MNKLIRNIFGNRFKNVEAYKIKQIKIDLRDITKETIKFILFKPKEERTNEDIATLKNFILLKSKFIDKLIQDHIDETMQEIVIMLSMLDSFYNQTKNKNEILYNINDKSENFYVILEGGVSILTTEQIDCEMNSEQYYNLIINFRKNNEKYLLEKTLEENIINFPIQREDVDIIDKIFLKIYILSKNNIKILKDNPHYLEIIFEKIGLKFSDLGIESYQEKLEEENKKILIENELIIQEKEDNLEQNSKKETKKLLEYDINEAIKICKENEEIILEKLKKIVPDNLCKKYYFLINTPELPITYFKYKEDKALQPLDYFGENENKYHSYKAVSNCENTELLIFSHNIYNEMISHMKSKFVAGQVDFLLDNFFFNSIYKGFFDKIYLKYFEYSKYYINQKILEENEPIRYIYFVKNGNVRILSNRSIIQNHILIKLINNILKRKNSYLLFGNSNPFDIDFKLYPELKGDFELLKNDIKLKKDAHLMTFQAKQCIGFECFYFGLNSLYTAVAISDKVEVYKIAVDKLVKILSMKNKKALNEFSIQSEKAIRILLDRIIKTNNSLLVKYTNQNKELYHQISYIVEKAINIIQAKNSEIKSQNLIKSKRKEQKKVEEDFLNNNKENNDIYLSKRKSHSADINNKNQEEKKKNKTYKNILNDFNEKENKNVNIYNKYDLTSQIKIFDQKANSIKEIYRELERENDELGRITNAENRKIIILKKQNENHQNFFKVSQGDKRIFIKSRNNSVNINDIQYHYSLKAKSYLNHIKNKNKKKSLVSLRKERNIFSEIYPFNNRYQNYKPYKYDLSKTLLMNKKLFEFSIFKNKRIFESNFRIDKHKDKIYKYKSSSDVDVDKFNLEKKKMIVINCQDLYNKYH